MLVQKENFDLVYHLIELILQPSMTRRSRRLRSHSLVDSLDRANIRNGSIPNSLETEESDKRLMQKKKPHLR